VLAILKPITGFLRVGYKKYAIKQTAFNAAMSYILNNAVTGSSSADYSIDLAKVLVSRGNLTGALNGVATYTNGVVTLNWADNSGSGNATATDKALIVVLNPTRAESVFDTGGSERGTISEDVNIPTDWVGDSVEVFLGFITADGKDVANSVYLGSVTIA
jgi:hypothetical protein